MDAPRKHWRSRARRNRCGTGSAEVRRLASGACWKGTRLLRRERSSARTRRNDTGSRDAAWSWRRRWHWHAGEPKPERKLSRRALRQRPTVRKLIGSTHVSLGGEIGSPHKWAFPYLNEEHKAYALKLLLSADALLLGRRTYEGLSSAYMQMAGQGTGVPSEFVERMNSIPKFVASRTLHETVWNATVIEG